MTHDQSGLKPSAGHLQAVVEAAAWRASLTESGLETSEAFEAWLAASPDHEAAWSETQAIWMIVDELATTPEMLRMRREALGSLPRRGLARFAFRPSRLAAASAIVLVLAGAAGAWLKAGTLSYQTSLGERRIIELADGSRIFLDANSQVRVRYAHASRRLELVRGQARFDVAHDASRPFSVTARDRSVIATGTAFNVDIGGEALAVTLIEGKVEVVDAGKPSVLSPVRPPAAVTRRRAVLNAGEQFTASLAAQGAITKGNVEQTTAWEDGQLVFDNEPIAAVAARVSRYTQQPIRVDPNVGDVRVSGVFKIGNGHTFVDAVTSFLPLAARVDENGATILYRRS